MSESWDKMKRAKEDSFFDKENERALKDMIEKSKVKGKNEKGQNQAAPAGKSSERKKEGETAGK